MRRLFYGATICLLAACSNSAALDPTQVATQSVVSIAPSPTPTLAVTTATGPQATAPADTHTIRIWWPSALYPDESSDAGKLLRQEIESYQTAHGNTVAIRVKRSDGLGSIYQTLRSGSTVAPTVMPDLALMERADLVQAAAGKLISPIDLTKLGIDDLFPAAQALGQVNNTLYGIPYTLEVQHAAYRTSVLTSPPQTLDDVIKDAQMYYFPAGTNKGVNLTLLAQYIAADGRLADDKGVPLLDSGPLLVVLRYYEQAVQAKVADSLLLDYTSVGQYWPLFVAGKTSLAQVDSTTFLAQRAKLTGMGAVAVPMPGDHPVLTLDGWMWVLTTSDPDRQVKALDAMVWLMRADQQSKFSQEIGVLPSRRSALSAWSSDSYVTFAGDLLDESAAPAPDTINPVVASALQQAFEDVLAGRKSAAEATDAAVAQVSATK